MIATVQEECCQFTQLFSFMLLFLIVDHQDLNAKLENCTSIVISYFIIRDSMEKVSVIKISTLFSFYLTYAVLIAGQFFLML